MENFLLTVFFLFLFFLFVMRKITEKKKIICSIDFGIFYSLSSSLSFECYLSSMIPFFVVFPNHFHLSAQLLENNLLYNGVRIVDYLIESCVKLE